MSDLVLEIKNLSKEYRLGTINTGTLSRDIASFIARKTGKEDPNTKVTEINILKKSFLIKIKLTKLTTRILKRIKAKDCHL